MQKFGDRWVKNIKLPLNPNPNDKEDSYINIKMQVQNKRYYGKRDLCKENWKMQNKNKKFVKHHFNEQFKKNKDNKKRQS